MTDLDRAGLTNLVDHLEHWSALQPDKILYSFLEVDGIERDSYTYLGFHERTQFVAQYLREEARLRNGDRALLVYTPGLEFIAAFVACIRIGVIPVPVYPPTPMSFESGLAKLTFIARDCGARAALTTRGFLRSYQLLLARRKISSLWMRDPALPDLEWVTTDDVRGVASDTFRNEPGEVLFLQYTSGSTSDPKGVIVSHRNVIHNGTRTIDHCPIGVSWLPQYHDMGLIGYYLYPIVMGGSNHGFSPLNFLKRPALWLQTISKVGATYTSSPNFGYDYCLREDKLPEEQLQGLDLSSLRVMMNAAEPVRAESYRRFYERFKRFGLRSDAYVVSYGLAENTLCVSHYGKQVLTINKQELQHRRLHVENGLPKNNNQVEVVSCGQPLDQIDVQIVDSESCEPLGEGRIGEVWVAGPSTCQGYWNRPEMTASQFRARLAGVARSATDYMRTGDLGFLREGELFICGRIKDLIIIHGVNYYPQDIEAIVEAASPAIRKGGVCAFNVDLDGEALVVMVEARNLESLPDPAEIARAVRTQYYVEPHTLVFVPHGEIAKTTSGKTSRSKTKEQWLAGEIKVLATHVFARRAEPTGELTGIRERFQYIVELYNLTGREEHTFAEIGIDSLTMVQLLDDIKKLLEEHGAGSLVEEVDIRLLQRISIAEFFSLIDQFQKSSDEPLRLLRFMLRRVQKEQEEYDRDCMRADSALQLHGASQALPSDDIRTVLLTGATGFFGPFLLASLLRKTPHHFVTLTRATDPKHGIERIKASLQRSRLLTPELEALFDQRVRVVCGDVARHNLGLRSEEWKELSTEVQAVCHNAALVNYVLNYDALRPHNVDGTREMLRFAATGTKKEFHLISSTFIFGWTVKGVLWETDSNAEMKNLDFGYAQSKWVAERLVLEAEKQGLKVRVYRPSLISASSGGIGSKDDIAIRLLAFMIKHGVAVTALNQVSFLPADVVADNIAVIFNQRETDASTVHITADNYYNMADVTRLITEEYGYRFQYFDISSFVREMNSRCTKDDLLYPLIDFFNRFYRKLAAMEHKRYSNDWYQRLRARAGDYAVEPQLKETVRQIVDFMHAEGVIPRLPDGRAAGSA